MINAYVSKLKFKKKRKQRSLRKINLKASFKNKESKGNEGR